jgi:alpha-amylase
VNVKWILTALSLITFAAAATPTLTITTPTTSRTLPFEAGTSVVAPLVKEIYNIQVSGDSPKCTQLAPERIKFNKPIPIACFEDQKFEVNIRFAGDYQFSLSDDKQNVTIKRQPKKSKSVFKRPLPQVECINNSNELIVVDIKDSFKNGEQVLEVLSGKTYVVENGAIHLQTSMSNEGLYLLERDQSTTSHPFTYRNANVYFIMVDRFKNGDSSNDQSYGRQKDGKQEIGTFHGGDLQGVIEQLDYIKSLGTSVIWLSPIVEQVAGFVGGGKSGSFPFYAYHGYWTKDFTKIDENFGSEAQLKTLVDEAHARGMKVILDAVVNHAGYATLADLQSIAPNVVLSSELPDSWAQWKPSDNQNWHSYNDLIDNTHKDWENWWGAEWVRANFPGYTAPGSNAMNLNLAGLPDFITESTHSVQPPAWLVNNPGTRVKARDNYQVSDYLIEWQTDWVKRFGVDGFRVDTVKHVEGEVWSALKSQANLSLEQWRSEHNINSKLPFWMIGEVWAHPATRSFYYDQGFDGLINFDMQRDIDFGAACFSSMEKSYAQYSQTMQQHPDFNPVSYISSHDTELFFSRYRSTAMQKQAANALLLSPGAIQVYYGDEVGRDIGPYADDFHQGTRSDMIWKIDAEREKILQHWRVLGQFRERHPAIGAGEHRQLPNEDAYVFSRKLENDSVVVVYTGNAAISQK